MIATLFYNPMRLSVGTVLWLVIPLCVAVTIVYKTIRTDNLKRLPVQITFLVGYILVGLAVLGVGLYLVQEYWP